MSTYAAILVLSNDFPFLTCPVSVAHPLMFMLRTLTPYYKHLQSFFLCVYSLLTLLLEDPVGYI